MPSHDEFDVQKDNQNVNLIQEQYGQIMSLLQHFQIGNGGESTSNVNSACVTANFAGIVACTSSIDFSKLSCNCFKNRADSWILDSGASNHMTFNKSLLTKIITLPYPLLVILPNGYKVRVTQIGSVTLIPDIILEKVLFIPSFKYNLISVHSLTKHERLVAFSNNSCLLQAPSMKRPLVIGKAMDGLYFLCQRCLQNKQYGPTVKVPFLSACCCACNTQCHLHSNVNKPSLTNKCVPLSLVNNSSASNK